MVMDAIWQQCDAVVRGLDVAQEVQRADAKYRHFLTLAARPAFRSWQNISFRWHHVVLLGLAEDEDVIHGMRRSSCRRPARGP